MTHRHTGRVVILLLSLVLAALLQGCASLKPAPSSVALAEPVVEMPGSFERGVFVADAMIDGVGPFRLVIDTGADAIAIRPEAAERLDSEPGGRSFITDGSGSVGLTAGSLSLTTLTLGSFEATGFDAIIHDFSNLQDLFEQPIDGVIGFPAFREVALIYDRAGSSVRIARSSDPPPTGGGVFPFQGKRAHFDLPLYDRTVRVLADTGANTTLSIRRSDVDRARYTVIGTRSARTLRSSMDEELVELNDALGFAGRRITSAKIYIGGKTRVLGTAWMKPFRVTFDQPHGVIVFEPAEPVSPDE
ncbi:MAG: retropepsin-like aspartic protease [Planctomycetota bacterium]